MADVSPGAEGAMRRISIAELLGFIAVLAVGFAAMRDGSPPVFCAAYTITLVALLIALLGAWVGTRPRGAWCGFAVFGWAYFLITFIPALNETIGRDLPTAGLFQGIGVRFHRLPDIPPSLPSGPGINTHEAALQLSMKSPPDPVAQAFLKRIGDYELRVGNSEWTGHLLVCWSCGLLGSIIGRVLAGRRFSSPAHRQSGHEDLALR
jgi:hypothetical protein